MSHDALLYVSVMPRVMRFAQALVDSDLGEIVTLYRRAVELHDDDMSECVAGFVVLLLQCLPAAQALVSHEHAADLLEPWDDDGDELLNFD